MGAIFRSADGAGVSKIFLTGYTPAPRDRFGRENAEIKKTSLGATETVPYACGDDIFSLIESLKKEGVEVVVVEQTAQAILYTGFVPKGKVAFVFGNEVSGVESHVLDVTDTHIQIPMLGKKESLNVSVCAGIILFHMRDTQTNVIAC